MGRGQEAGSRGQPVPHPHCLTQDQQLPSLQSSASHQRPQHVHRDSPLGLPVRGSRNPRVTPEALNLIRATQLQKEIRSLTRQRQRKPSITCLKKKTPVKLLVLFLKASSWGLGAHGQWRSSAFTEKGRPHVARPRNCNAVRRPVSRPLF